MSLSIFYQFLFKQANVSWDINDSLFTNACHVTQKNPKPKKALETIYQKTMQQDFKSIFYFPKADHLLGVMYLQVHAYRLYSKGSHTRYIQDVHTYNVGKSTHAHKSK